MGCMRILIFLTVGLVTVEALECYKCENFVTDSDNAALKGLVSESNPVCENYSPLGSDIVTCPDNGNYKCGIVRGKIIVNMIFSKVTIKSVARDCLEVPSYSEDGCAVDNSQANKLMKSAVDVLTSLFGFTVEGNVCTCSTDLCAAGCDEGSISMAGFCLPIWGAGVGGAAFLVLIVAVCTCCCCCGCCSCCRKSGGTVVGRPGVTVLTTTTPGAVVFDNANGVRGMNNPGYGYQVLTNSNPV